MNVRAYASIDPELFTYETYEPAYWQRLGCGVFDTSLDRLVAGRAVGTCDPSRLAVRPRADGVAVMCEDEDGRFWFHWTGCAGAAEKEDD